MGLLVILSIGVVVGWLAAVIAKRRRTGANLLAGALGSLIAAVSARSLGASNVLAGRVDSDVLLASLGGAAIILLMIELTRSGTDGSTRS